MNSSDFKRFMILWVGELISAIGGGLTSFGLGVYVFRETGSAGSMAIVSLLAFLPAFLLSAPAGVLADRYDRRWMMMIGDGLSAFGIIYIFACMLNGGASLIQICIGVCISSFFSSLIDPAYKATVTDLLSDEDYAKASGLVGIAGSARYLISPLLAGILLSFVDIKWLLLIDICTFFVTVLTTWYVKKGLTSKLSDTNESFADSFKEGFAALKEKRGVLVLIAVSSVMTMFMGAIQILSEPMILDFMSSTVLGITETLCATGMLVTSLIVGVKGIRNGYVRTLSLSLCGAGIAMLIFGSVENIIVISVAGFCFFGMLPLANSCLDYLVRTNIAPEKQGRAWGLIGFLSQIGYIVAYGCFGLIADMISRNMGIRIGRSAGVVIMISGILQMILATAIYFMKDIRELETINN